MNKKLFIILIIIIMFLSLYATNPSKRDFEDYIFNSYSGDSLELYESDISIDELSDFLVGKISGSLADLAYSRKNFYLFSVYKDNNMGFEYNYLGIFKLFIPIKKIYFNMD